MAEEKRELGGMPLSAYEILPAAITSISDPKGAYGIQFASPLNACGEGVSSESQPWAFPLTTNGCQRVSKEEVGHMVWVLHNTQEGCDQEYFYIPMFDIHSSMGAKAAEPEADVLVHRDGAGSTNEISHSSSSGTTSKCGGSTIHQSPSGNVSVGSSGGAGASFNGNATTLGNPSEDPWHLVKGEKFKELFTVLQQFFDILGQNMEPEWLPTERVLCKLLASGISVMLEDILSENVTFNDGTAVQEAAAEAKKEEEKKAAEKKAAEEKEAGIQKEVKDKVAEKLKNDPEYKKELDSIKVGEVVGDDIRKGVAYGMVENDSGHWVYANEEGVKKQKQAITDKYTNKFTGEIDKQVRAEQAEKDKVAAQRKRKTEVSVVKEGMSSISSKYKTNQPSQTVESKTEGNKTPPETKSTLTDYSPYRI